MTSYSDYSITDTLLIFALTCAIAVVLSGCGGSSTPAEPKKVLNAVTKQELSVVFDPKSHLLTVNAPSNLIVEFQLPKESTELKAINAVTNYDLSKVLAKSYDKFLSDLANEFTSSLNECPALAPAKWKGGIHSFELHQEKTGELVVIIKRGSSTLIKSIMARSKTPEICAKEWKPQLEVDPILKSLLQEYDSFVKAAA